MIPANIDQLYHLARRAHGITTRKLALQAGLSDEQIGTLIARGAWRRVLPGSYYVNSLTTPGSPTQPSRLLDQVPALSMMSAARYFYGAEVVAGAHTAALLLGEKDLLPQAPDTLRLIVPPELNHRRQPKCLDSGWRIRLSCYQLPDADVQLVRGFRATTPVRTLFDLASHYGFTDLVCLFDAALREKWVDPAALSALIHQGRGPSYAIARRAAEHARVGAESVLETLWRLRLCEVGLAPDELQYEYVCDGQRLRADFAWHGPVESLLLETDGTDVHSTPRAVLADRARQNKFVLAGHRVLRATASDLYDPDERLINSVREGLVLIRRPAAA